MPNYNINCGGTGSTNKNNGQSNNNLSYITTENKQQASNNLINIRNYNYKNYIANNNNKFDEKQLAANIKTEPYNSNKKKNEGKSVPLKQSSNNANKTQTSSFFKYQPTIIDSDNNQKQQSTKKMNKLNTTTPYEDLLLNLQLGSFPIDARNIILQNSKHNSQNNNIYSDNSQQIQQRNKSSTFFPSLSNHKQTTNLIYDNNTIIEEKYQNQRTITEGSATYRSQQSFYQNNLQMNNILNTTPTKKQYNLGNCQSQNDIEAINNSHQISINNNNNNINGHSKEDQTNKGLYLTQGAPHNEYNSSALNKSVLTSIIPSISTSQVTHSPDKKSFRIKYNSSNVKRSDSLVNNESQLHQQSQEQQNQQQQQIKSINSQQNKFQKQKQSNTQSTQDINLLNSNQHSIVNNYYIQNGLTQIDKLKLIDTLNIQPLQSQKNIKQINAKLQIKNDQTNLLMKKINQEVSQNQNDDYNMNKMLYDKEIQQNFNQKQSTPLKQNIINNSQQYHSTPTTTQQNQEALMQVLKQQNNKEGFQKMQEYIKEKQKELQSEANQIRSQISDQQAAIKSSILNKNNYQYILDSNKIIQDFRKLNARQSLSPEKSVQHQKLSYNRQQSSQNSDIQNNNNNFNKSDHSSSFYLAPSLNYEPLIPNSLTSHNQSQINYNNQQYFMVNGKSANQNYNGNLLGQRNSYICGINNNNNLNKIETEDLKLQLEQMKLNKILTDEMIEDNILKNDNLSLEAISQINLLLQNQRTLKERIKVANGIIGQHIPLIYENNKQLQKHQTSFLHVKGIESPFQLIKSLLEAKAIKEIKEDELNKRSFRKNNEETGLTRLLAKTIDNKKFLQSTNIQSDFQTGQMNTPKSNTNQLKSSNLNSISPNITKQKFKNISPRNIVFSLNPETKIKIYHKPLTHLIDHPINKAISKINYIIKLIFKSHKQLPLQFPIINSGQNQQSAQYGQINPFQNQPQHIIEEAKLNEIQRMSKQFGIQIPKRFDNKTAHREYFQSKEFIINLKIKMNQILHSAINDSNGMTQLLKQQQNEMQIGNNNIQQSQKFFVGRGNNDAAVKSVLKQRSWWIQHNEEDFNEVNLVWTQWKKQKHIDYLANNGKNNPNKSIKIYGKMEQNKQLTNKKGVFINMRDYYLSLDEDPFDVLPLTFLVKSGVNDPEFKRFTDYYNNLVAKSKTIEQQRNEALATRQKQLQEINDQKEQERKHQRNPNTIVLPSLKRKRPSYFSEDSEDDEFDGSEYSDDNNQKELEQDEEIQEIKRKYRVPRNVWIIKPGENTNRGNGINVSSNLNEIKNLVQKANSNAKKEKTYIIQKYIDYPLLIHSRKFDFRCYGIMTSMNGNLKGYFYEDAYIRTSCKEFDIDNLNNKYIHLTNDAVQKHSQDYGKYENGNKMSLQDFQKYLKHQFPTFNIDIKRDLMPQIRKLVTDSYRSVFDKIDPGRLHNTFELFGYDFMLDEDFKLYLIEVNTNPCLEMSSPLLCRIIPEVLDNAFRIVLDPVFPSPDLNNNRKYTINEIPQEIKFTLVFDEAIDAPELKNLRNKFNGIKEEIESDEEDELAQDENQNNEEINGSLNQNNSDVTTSSSNKNTVSLNN